MMRHLSPRRNLADNRQPKESIVARVRTAVEQLGWDDIKSGDELLGGVLPTRQVLIDELVWSELSEAVLQIGRFFIADDLQIV